MKTTRALDTAIVAKNIRRDKLKKNGKSHPDVRVRSDQGIESSVQVCDPGVHVGRDQGKSSVQACRGKGKSIGHGHGVASSEQRYYRKFTDLHPCSF